MVEYASAKDASDLAFGEGLKMVLFSHFSQCFWAIQPTRIFFFKKSKNLIFEPCINAFHLRPFLGFYNPRTTIYAKNIFTLSQNCDFS
jgi:hypothetical protein